MDKPQKPTNLLPNSFGGQKEPFSNDKIANGYQPDVPDILGGANLNNFLDAVGGNFEYNNKISDFIKDIPINHVPTVDENNKLVYKNIVDIGGGGYEVCDIGMALYVDESKGLRRYLNGQIVGINSNTQGFLERLLKIKSLHPSLFTTESNWQAEKAASDYKQVGKFVLNYASDGVTIESVRLPAVVNVQGLLDLKNLGMTVKAGLPTLTTNSKGAHTHTRGTMNITGSFRSDSGEGEPTGAFTRSYIGSTDGGGDAPAATHYFDASRAWTGKTSENGTHSHTITGTSNTVQPEAIQYPYFIQIATGSETEVNIINKLELNNPFFFGKSEYFENEPNNLSWLKSNGQWNSKAVYANYYDWILKNANKGAPGFKLSTASDITDYDFVINTADETFRLPILNGSEDLQGDRVKKFELKASGSTYTAPANGWFNISKKVTAANQYIYIGNTAPTANSLTNTLGVEGGVNVTRSLLLKRGDTCSIIYDAAGDLNYFQFVYAKGNGSLYYYVGETAQNANLIDAGRLGEALVLKINAAQAAHAAMPSNRYIDLTLGASSSIYTAPADGYVLLQKYSTAAGQYVRLTSHTDAAATSTYTLCSSQNIASSAEFYPVATLPVSKGQTFKIGYNSSSTQGQFFRFIYAEGAQ